jgi:hypothetical protein
MGCPVEIVNGLISGRLELAIQGKQTIGTKVKGD